MSRIPIGLELYSVRQDLSAEPEKTLEQVAAMGYEGVEFAGPPQLPAETYRALLEKTGLICCGWHTPFQMVQDDQLEATIELNKTVGNTRIIVPGLPNEYKEDLNAWKRAAAFFNKLAKKLATVGMQTGYHNHIAEFKLTEGRIPWEVLGENTDPAVILQIDTGNAYCGGGDPLAMIRKFPDRGGTVHLKPYSRALGKEDAEQGFQTMIGDDDTPWEEIFSCCDASGATEWYIVEYEADNYTPLDGVERCMKALQKMGKR